jgi:xanthine dehydrogenase accessory factor
VNEVYELIRFWERRDEEPLALATLVRARGSSYRRPGARMLISRDGTSAGSLSAGCIEDEVIACAREVLASGEPRLMSFDTRRRFGCNGSIDIFVERAPDEVLRAIRQNFHVRTPCQIATVWERGEEEEFRLGTYVAGGYVESGALLQTIDPALRLIIVGTGPDAIALRKQAMLLGWEAAMIEAIPELSDVPDSRTAAIVATHNFGRDCAALRYLLPLGLRYVGLIGPRRRRDEILIDIIDSGAEVTSQLFAPAGLHLAAESPEEIALSIAAEIQCVFAGGTTEHLCQRKAPIHDVRCGMGNIGAIVLAAGSSSRLGQPKQLLDFWGEPLVHRLVCAAQEGGCSPVVLVTGELHGPVARAATDLHPLVIQNENWLHGLGSSIRVGVAQLITYDINAVVLLACDQPAVDSGVVRALIEEHERSGRPIVASHYADTLGIPALLHRSCFGELLRLPDERGAKMLIEKNPSRVAQVDFPAGLFDLDTPEDLLAWQKARSNNSACAPLI